MYGQSARHAIWRAEEERVIPMTVDLHFNSYLWYYENYIWLSMFFYFLDHAVISTVRMRCHLKLQVRSGTYVSQHPTDKLRESRDSYNSRGYMYVDVTWLLCFSRCSARSISQCVWNVKLFERIEELTTYDVAMIGLLWYSPIRNL